MDAPVAHGDPSSSSLLQMEAVEVVLQGIGEDIKREGLLKTPLRVASAFQWAVSGYQLSAREIIGSALFSEPGTGGGAGCGGGSGGMVIVRDIDSFALCESCLLPFRLRCHVVYVPCGERVVGLSKLPRVAEIFAKRLQNPQKFADEVVQALNDSFRPLGVGVVVESWHLQWPGVCENNGGSREMEFEELLGFGWVPMLVNAGKGQFENVNCSLWDEFLAILQLEDVDMARPPLGVVDVQSVRRNSCPFLVYDGQEVSSLGSFDSSLPEVTYNASSGLNSLVNGAGLTVSTVSSCATMMAVGVESLLRAMGEDPSKEELRCTTLRFVCWIMSATQGSRGSSSIVQDQGSNDNVNQSNGSSSPLSNGTLSNGANAPNDHGASGSIGALQSSTNSVLRYGNGTANDNNYTFGNGTSLLELDDIPEVDNHAEDQWRKALSKSKERRGNRSAIMDGLCN